MPEKIVQLNEEIIKGQLKELVRESPGFSRGECQDSDISLIFAISCCELVATECLLK